MLGRSEKQPTISATAGSSSIVRGLTAFSDRERTRLLWISAAATVLIAVVDFEVKPNVSLGYLYVVPILIAAGFLERWQIAAYAALCAVMREKFGPFSSDDFFWTREGLVFGAFLSSGLLVREIMDGRRRSDEQSRRLEAQIKLRQDAEEQLRVFVESNPAAILTGDKDLHILHANAAAARVFACPIEELVNSRLDTFLPDLKSVPIDTGKRFFRTNMECTGRRRDGSLLAADVWFSTYETSGGLRLAAIILDLTEEMREREDTSLDSMLMTSRVLVGAVLHEIRNLSAAASVAHANLRRLDLASESEDFRVLGTLVESLERIASSELALLADRNVAGADLLGVLHEFRLVAEPSIQEARASLAVLVDKCPRVRIDSHSLLQVLLNLSRNSIRALRAEPVREICLSLTEDADAVLLRFQDSGPGVEDPEILFQPFRTTSETTGLGLYVSRAIVRSFGGELYYEPSARGAQFVIRLVKAAAQRGGRGYDGAYSIHQDPHYR